jgi:prepilin-type N-terminal cleavage/methylation domain-containing protein
MAKQSVSRKGMTLIEVLIALVILSVGVSSMMVAMSRALGVVRTARNREMARALIRQVDITYPIDKEKIEELSESGDFEDNPGYTWFREIMMVDEEERPGLFLITTRVSWSERGREAFEEFTSYKYAPEAEILKSQL